MLPVSQSRSLGVFTHPAICAGKMTCLAVTEITAATLAFKVKIINSFFFLAIPAYLL
jgi:hypothetical protein